MADLSRYLVHAQLRGHRERVERARDEFRRAAALGPVVVATSWGKDSVALADLALETLGPVPLLHLASSYRLPGWEPVAAHFVARTIVHEVEPRRSLAETIAWLREVGLGYERERPQAAVQALKKDPGAEWCLKHGFAVQALGMRAEESKGRRACFRARTPTYQLARGLWVTNPLAWWSTVDVWAYIAARELPYHRLYDLETHGYTREEHRNTGWLTTIDAGRGRLGWLRAHFPEQYRALAREFPQVERFA